MPTTTAPLLRAVARYLVLPLLLLLVAAHLQRYLRPPSEGPPQVLQAPAASVTPALLAERQPLIIDDSVVDHAQLLATVFRWQYVSQGPTEMLTAASGTCVATARFTLIFFPRSPALEQQQQQQQPNDVLIEPPPSSSSSSSSSIDLGSRSTPAAAAVLVRLGASGRTLVLPPKWRYALAAPDPAAADPAADPAAAVAYVVKLHDPISWMLSRCIA